MVRTINNANFGKKPMVTCYTCHRGGEKPEITPSLAEQYGSPALEDPDKFEIIKQAPRAPSADEVFDKYIRAVGGTGAANPTNFIAKGTYEGYDTDGEKVPVEVFAKAPDQRSVVVHLPSGDKITTFDGHDGWVAEPDTQAALMALSGGNLDGAKIDAMLSFPLGIKAIGRQWRGATTTIDGRDVNVVEGTDAQQSAVRLYFDKDSGLLVRMVRYANTVVGQVPTEVNYSNCRAVSGVVLPFKWTTTWVDGRSTTELSEVQVNALIDPARFARPATPATH